MTQTPTLVQDLSAFANDLHLRPTAEAVVEHVTQLCASGQQTAAIKALHTGTNVSKAPADDSAGTGSSRMLS